MKKASKILLMVAGIFAVLSFLTAVVFAIIFFVAPSVPALQQAIADGIQYAMDEGMQEQYLEMLQWAADHVSDFANIMGGSLLGAAFVQAISAVFAFIGVTSDGNKKGLYIVNAIIGFLAGSLLQLVGGVLGIIGGGSSSAEPAKVEEVPAEAKVEEKAEEKAEPAKEEKPAK